MNKIDRKPGHWVRAQQGKKKCAEKWKVRLTFWMGSCIIGVWKVNFTFRKGGGKLDLMKNRLEEIRSGRRIYRPAFKQIGEMRPFVRLADRR